MNVENIREVVNQFYNNNYHEMMNFYNLPEGNRCRAIVVIRALVDDLVLENLSHRIVTIILERMNQLSQEMTIFNNRHENADNNHWVEFYGNTHLFMRAMSVVSGLLLINLGQINLPNEVVDNMYNQLDLHFLQLNNINEEHQIN